LVCREFPADLLGILDGTPRDGGGGQRQGGEQTQQSGATIHEKILSENVASY
jgi:hypothetical protein